MKSHYIRWAQRFFCACLLIAPVCAGQDAARARLQVGDGQLSLTLEQGAQGATEARWQVGESVLAGIGGPLWVLETPNGEVRPSAWTLKSGPEGEGPHASLLLAGKEDSLSWELTFEVLGPGLIKKQLKLTSEVPVRLDRVKLWLSEGATAPQVVSTAHQDIGAFFRQGSEGLFVSLDFPYSRVEREGNASAVTYPPYRELEAGEVYETHSLTIGATALTGELRFGTDTGETAAFEAYIQRRFPPRFDRPMYATAGIVNRYTMPKDGAIWYTYKDHPTLTFNLDLLKRELALMPKIGMEYYQLFPGVFDWAEGEPKPETVQEIVDYANDLGVRVGGYSGANHVFCPHYNEHGNTLDRPEWRMQGQEGQQGNFCFGQPEFIKYYAETVAENSREFGFEVHILDFLSISPCWADHGHPPGEDSLYHQVFGLVEILEALNAVDPDMMTWSNSGNWAEFLPKIAWWNHNLYLTDPFIASPWQGLNMTRLLDDARREQMVSLHHTRFIPYRFLTNCQYFFSQNSVVPDIRNYQYGALSTIAVAPNLCLAEIRGWMDALPPHKFDEVTAFYTKWTDFLEEHYELWTRTWNAGEDTGIGAVEIYGHAKEDHGFIFLVNPQYWNRTVEVPLDERLGFHAEGKAELYQHYPVEQLLLTSEGPFPAYGSTLKLEAPAQQVRVIEVRRAPERVESPRVYGIPGAVEEQQGGSLLLKTQGVQGTTHRFAVVIPEDAPAITGAAVRTDVPKQAKRLYSDTPLQVTGQEGNATLFELTFRRTQAPMELRNWQVQAGTLEAGTAQGFPEGMSAGEALQFPLFNDLKDVSLPLNPYTASATLGRLSGFCGAYVENAFREEQETWIAFSTEGPAPQPAKVVSGETIPAPGALPALATADEREWWLSTTFHLPFMYTYGSEPAFEEHTLLVLPFLQPQQVERIQAWVNGKPLEVESYNYPRRRDLFTWWADLVGSGAFGGGDNTLVLHVRFAS